MHLVEAIEKITSFFSIDKSLFIEYMAEDTVGGYSPVAEERTFKGPWTIEVQTLYALIRSLQPHNVLEIGNAWGNSTSHIGTAIRRNGVGRLTSIDEEDLIPPEIMAEFSDVADFHICDVREWDFTNPSIDFCFDDAAHNEEICWHIWREFADHAQPGAVIVSHDSEHFLKGPGTRAGIEHVVPKGEYLSLLIDPALCGLAMWRKPE